MDVALFEGRFECGDQFIFDKDRGTVWVLCNNGIPGFEPDPALIQVAGSVERLEWFRDKSSAD